MYVLDLLPHMLQSDFSIWTRRELWKIFSEHSKYSSESSLLPTEVKTSVCLIYKEDSIIEVHPIENLGFIFLGHNGK